MVADAQVFLNIRCSIEIDDLDRALELFSSLSEKIGARERNEVSLLKGRLYRITTQERIGLLKYEDISSEKTRIARAILELADLVQKNNLVTMEIH